MRMDLIVVTSEVLFLNTLWVVRFRIIPLEVTRHKPNIDKSPNTWFILVRKREEKM